MGKFAIYKKIYFLLSMLNNEKWGSWRHLKRKQVQWTCKILNIFTVTAFMFLLNLILTHNQSFIEASKSHIGCVYIDLALDELL